jgi:DNA repair ATPase RecN
MEDVRSIAAARDDVQSTRELLEGALGRLGEAQDIVEQLERRKGQLDHAESRLARAGALVRNLGTSIETLESQRAIVEQVVEQAGVLEFQSKQAEALIGTLRHERELASRMQAAVAETRKQREHAKKAS